MGKKESRACVLVVEDDWAVRSALSTVLRNEGYSVAAAENGKEALRFLKSNSRPCVIVLDLVMPDMDGWTLRDLMSLDRELDRIPVIVISAVQRERAARRLNPMAFVPKPIDLDRLLGLIDGVC